MRMALVVLAVLAATGPVRAGGQGEPVQEEPLPVVAQGGPDGEAPPARRQEAQVGSGDADSEVCSLKRGTLIEVCT